jgi:hypothetical protein
MTIEELNENNFFLKKTFPSIPHLPSWPTRKKIKEKKPFKSHIAIPSPFFLYSPQ